MKAYLLALLLNPILALVFLTTPVVIALWLWRWMPDGRLKRFLFTSYGKDSGPWVTARREARSVVRRG